MCSTTWMGLNFNTKANRVIHSVLLFGKEQVQYSSLVENIIWNYNKYWHMGFSYSSCCIVTNALVALNLMKA